MTYIDTTAVSDLRRYRLLVGIGKADARRALEAIDSESTSIHVRHDGGTRAEYYWRGHTNVFEGRFDALVKARNFVRGRAISSKAAAAINEWFARGARAELAIVFIPV
jgi:hypothetical protein